MAQSTLAKLIADFETSLASKMAIGATSATLLNATDDDGVALPAGRYFLTIDGNNSSKEHISCTLNSTSISDIKTLSRQGTETSGTLRAHRVGAKVVLTDWAHLKVMNDLLDGTTKFDPSVVLEYSGTATIDADNQLATKVYVDNVSISGAPDSSTTVKGIVKMSVAPASATDPIAVGTNDGRVPTQDENDALAGTSGTPSTSNKFVTEADVAPAKTASKIARRDANGDILVSTTPTSGDAAASKTYTDTLVGNSRYISSSTNTTTAIPSGANIAFINADATGPNTTRLFAVVDANISPVTVYAVGGGTALPIGYTATWNTGGNLVLTAAASATGVSNVKISFYK